MLQPKRCKESYVVKTSIVLPPDTNFFGTMFGGKLMAYIDDVAAIAAMRHSRRQVVTASTDSVDFLYPIHEGNAVSLEAFVTYTGRTSMEVFVKVLSEELLTGRRKICAVSFITMVAVDQNGKPVEVPQVIPESEIEKKLYESAKSRAERRKKRKLENESLAKMVGSDSQRENHSL